MRKIAAIFGGQGSQYPGMGKELYSNFACVREIYAKASEVMGFDVAKISFEGTPEELSRTIVSQPVIFTHAAAALAAFREKAGNDVDIQAVAGHSLGEYTALYCAGVLSLEDALHIISERAQAMETVAGAGVMFAVMGSDEKTVAAACNEAGGLVWPVNYNLPGQTVIAGEAEPCAKAADILKGKGAKVKQLAVGSAFHTSLMNPAAERLSKATVEIEYRPAQCDFYSNLTGGKCIVDDYSQYFAKHMVNPVRFVQEMQAMAEDGIDTCVEFGPKKTAATLAKKNVGEFAVFNVEDVQSLEKTVQEIKAS